MKRIAVAVGALALGLVAGCGSQVNTSPRVTQAAQSRPPVASASQSQAGVSGVPAGPDALPCDPHSNSCWVPGVGETYMSYKPAQHYTDARVLAAAAHCQTLSGSVYSPPRPTAQAAECTLNGSLEGSYLTEAMIFSSPLAEANEAQKIAQGAIADDTADYGVVGPGWMIATITTVTDAEALQIQNTTGGAVVCFPGRDNSMSSC